MELQTIQEYIRSYVDSFSVEIKRIFSDDVRIRFPLLGIQDETMLLPVMAACYIECSLLYYFFTEFLSREEKEQIKICLFQKAAELIPGFGTAYRNAHSFVYAHLHPEFLIPNNQRTDVFLLKADNFFSRWAAQTLLGKVPQIESDQQSVSLALIVDASVKNMKPAFREGVFQVTISPAPQVVREMSRHAKEIQGDEVRKQEWSRIVQDYDLWAIRGNKAAQIEMGSYWSCYEPFPDQLNRMVRCSASDSIELNFYIGMAYEHNIWFETDPCKAYPYYELAARKGHPRALFRAARCLLSGIGTAIDREKAYVYLVNAAGRKNKMAIGLLAKEYLVKSESGHFDLEKAYKSAKLLWCIIRQRDDFFKRQIPSLFREMGYAWMVNGDQIIHDSERLAPPQRSYSISEENINSYLQLVRGSTDPQLYYELGMYFQKKSDPMYGLPQFFDCDAADLGFYWYNRAAMAGHNAACLHAFVKFDSSDCQDDGMLGLTIGLYKDIAVHNDARACDWLAEYYGGYYGKRSTADEQAFALKMRAKAAELGCAHAQWRMGQAARFAGNREEAYYWTRKAAEQGDNMAMEDLQKLDRGGSMIF